MTRALVGVLGALSTCSACTPSPVNGPPVQPSVDELRAVAETASAASTLRKPLAGLARYDWQPDIRSPRPSTDVDPVTRDLVPLCGESDAAMRRVARRLAARQAADLPPLDMAELTFAMRAAGSPHVWPRAWTLEGADLDAIDTRSRFRRFLASFDDGGVRRCGMASIEAASGKRIIAALVVDALADLSPVPVRGRPGQWIEIEARMLVEATSAEVVVLGPRGSPHAIPTSFDAGRVTARFHADHPGTWRVQALADVASGSRPIVEASVHVGVPPPNEFRSQPAPGEEAGPGDGDDADSVQRMVNAARASEGIGPLRRDRRLDGVAKAHAVAMLHAQRVGHDVGDGNPRQRVEAAGIDFVATGENVARARTLRRAHRALWTSPSHRGNVLLDRFDSIGIGVVRDEEGVWVCEVFADF